MVGSGRLRLTQPRFAWGPDSARVESAPDTIERFPTPATRMSVPERKKISGGAAAGCEMVIRPVVQGKPLLPVTMLLGKAPPGWADDGMVPDGPTQNIVHPPPPTGTLTIPMPFGSVIAPLSTGPNIVVPGGEAAGAPG
jgi:hypothetical protein